jgi:hypothetical protein
MLQTIRTGAAATRRSAKKNPMQVLVDLVEGDPSADPNRLFKVWWPIIQSDDDYLEAVARHAFTNFLTSLDRDRRASATRRKTKRMAQQHRDAVSALTSKIKNLILLDLQLPNGKKLRNCTFAECSAAGGWFKLLATRGRPSEVVGEVLTEDDLRKLR